MVTNTTHFVRTFSNNEGLVTRRREHIARCAARVFAKKGYENANIREIAKACRMSHSNLYHYVGSKQDILYLVIHYALSMWLQFVEKSLPAKLDGASATEALKQVIRSMFKMVEEIQDFTMLVYHETRIMEPNAQRQCLDIETRAIDNIAKLLTEGCATREFQIEDTTLVAHNIIILCEMWAVRRWFLRKRYNLEEYIEKQVEFILRGISSDKNTTSKA